MLRVDALARYANRFRMADVTGVDIPGERGGLIPDSDYLTRRYGRRGWSRGAALNIAIGQGELLTTPLEMAVFVATIANGGERVVPNLVRARIDAEGRRHELPVPDRSRVVTELRAELALVRDAMRRVVGGEHGTGRLAAVEGLEVAGKTGTAQNPHGEDHAIFASYAPADDPHLALVILLERRGHGGARAAPVAGSFWRAYRDWLAEREKVEVAG